MRVLRAVIASVALPVALAGCASRQAEPAPPSPSVTSTPSATTGKPVARQEKLPQCGELGKLSALPAGATAAPAKPGDNPRECEWRSKDTAAQITLWQYATAATANATFTNLVMLCPGEEIGPVGRSARSAWCARKTAPACNLIVNQGVFHLNMVWTAPKGTDQASCRISASALGAQVSELLN